MKQKWLAFLMVACILLSLAACREPAKEPENEKNDPNLITVGDYQVLYTGSEITQNYDGDDVIVISYTYTNNSKEKQSFEWALYYTVMQDGVELEYASIFVDEDSFDMVDDANILDVDPGHSNEVKLTYRLRNLTSPVKVEFEEMIGDEKESHTIDLSTAVRKQTEATEPTEPEESTEPTEPTEPVQPDNVDAYAWWNGDWYGWWIMGEGGGELDGLDDGSHWYDCCATIEIDADGNGTMILWDEDSARDDWLAYADVTIQEGMADVGALVSESGNFADGAIGQGDWTADPYDMDFDNMICISATYVDPNNSENYMEYTVWLRPWGVVWDDVEAEDPDLLPYYYYDWYLPAVEAGKPMPDQIGAN